MPRSSASAPARSTLPPRVLVVDDQASVRELLSVILSAEGVEVRTAAGGEQALRLAFAEPFDLVTIDLAMPGMDGRALAAALKADPRTAGMAQMIVSAHPFGVPDDLQVDAVLAKPFDLVAFTQTVQRLLPMPMPAPQSAQPTTMSLAPRASTEGTTDRAGNRVRTEQQAARRRGVEHYRDAVQRGTTASNRRGSVRGALETLVATASAATGYPMAVLSLLDDSRQYPLAVVGTGFEDDIEVSPLCALVALGERAMVADDVPPAKRQPHLGSEVAAYIGVPLFGREGLVIGSLCVLDDRPHRSERRVVELLENVAELAQAQLELLRREAEMGVYPDHVLLEQLRAGLTRDEIEVWYQPVVDLVDRTLVGVEALVRWRHPERGLLLPGVFLPLAEDTDLILEVDRAVLERACRDLVELRLEYPALTVSVNVSGATVVQHDFAEGVEKVLADTGLEPSALVVELTESALVRTDSVSGRQLNRLRAMGVAVLLDDFGTGWNSLEQLLRLPTDGLKIERLFTAALGSPVGDALVASVLTLGRDLALDVVVEGIETEAQAQTIREMGGRFGQGHHIAAAMPANELTGWTAGFAVGLPGRSRQRYR